MDLSVSIVNWNTREDLESCLRSVLSQVDLGFEIIVVDNASSDQSAEMVRSKFPQVTLITNSSNLGFSAAQNQAVEAGSGKYILMLNPDTVIPETDTLSKLVSFAENNPDVGIIGPRIEYPDGRLHFSARKFPTIGTGLFRRTPLGRLFPKNRFVREYVMADWSHTETKDIDWVSGAALMIRRDTIEEIGGLDTRFFMYCEDVDIAYRAHLKGWRVCYYPMSRIVHKIGAASDKSPFKMIYHFHRSMFRFFLKHYAQGWKILLAPLILAGLSSRAAMVMTQAIITIQRSGKNSKRLVQ